MSNEMVRFSVRFNLNNKDHLNAWKLLSGISKGNRSSFCIKAILNMESKPNENDLAYQIKKSNEILGKIASTNLIKEVKRKKKLKNGDVTIIVNR